MMTLTWAILARTGLTLALGCCCGNCVNSFDVFIWTISLRLFNAVYLSWSGLLNKSDTGASLMNSLVIWWPGIPVSERMIAAGETIQEFEFFLCFSWINLVSLLMTTLVRSNCYI